MSILDDIAAARKKDREEEIRLLDEAAESALEVAEVLRGFADRYQGFTGLHFAMLAQDAEGLAASLARSDA